MVDKLGLRDQDDSRSGKTIIESEHIQLLHGLFDVMQNCGSDFTNTFRTLSNLTKSNEMTDQDSEALKELISLSAPK